MQNAIEIYKKLINKNVSRAFFRERHEPKKIIPFYNQKDKFLKIKAYLKGDLIFARISKKTKFSKNIEQTCLEEFFGSPWEQPVTTFFNKEIGV